MKHLTQLLTFTLCVSPAFAQFSTLPPSSNLDAITVHSAGLNAVSSHWQDPAGLGAYAISSDGYADPLSAGATDSHLGLVWQETVSAGVQSAKTALNSKGGVIRALFVGETAGWLNDFGYTYSGKPTGSESFTVFQNIQSVGAAPTVTFGNYVDISLLSGQASTFDFWYNSVGAPGLDTPSSATGRGGIYTAFNPLNTDPSSATNQFLWARNPIKVSTWMPSIGAYANVDTYLVSVEDWRIAAGSDRDYSDFRFALQFFDATGTPLAQVPESSASAIVIGLGTLTGVFILRRRSATTV